MIPGSSKIILDDPSFKPKRQRLAFTCEACRKRKIKCDKAKPKCSTCARLGKVCKYEMSNWVNTHVESYTVFNREENTKPKSREQLLREIEYWKSKAENIDIPGVLDTAEEHSNGLKLANYLEDSPLAAHSLDLIDFHEPHSATYFQESNHEQLSPLGSMSIHKDNHFMELFLCPKYLVQYLMKHEMDPAMDDTSKWALLFGVKSEDTRAKSNIKTLVEYRGEITDSTSFIDTNLTKSSISVFVVQEVQALLPGKCEFYMLLDHFFNNMWSLRPIVDQKLFLDDVQRMVPFGEDGKVAKVKLEKRTDINTLAMLLILLRYSYTSISNVDEVDLSEKLRTLKENTYIPVRTISVAYFCLSTLSAGQKRTLNLVQALMLLVFYYKDRPEECLSSSLSQFYTLFGLIKESALAIGLHKDPIYYGIPTETHLANLRRRLWLTFVTLDTETQVLGGCLSTLPNSNTINVNFPVMSFKTPLEQAEIDELTKDSQLRKIYNPLCEHINNLTKKPNLATLIHLLDQASAFVDENYSMSKLSDLTNFEVDSQLYKATVYKNEKILEKKITLSSTKITTYQLICGHYEDNRFANLNIFKELNHRYIQEVFHSLDMSGGLLSDAFRCYLDPLKSSFAIYPFVTHLIYKLINALQATLLCMFHCQDLLICHLYMSVSGVEREYCDELVSILFNILNNYVDIVKQSVGSKTYAGLKMVCSANINTYFLKSFGFFSLTRFCNYYDTMGDENLNDEQFWDETKKNISESGSSAIEQGLFSAHTQWLRMSSSYRAALSNTLDTTQREHFRFCSSVVNVSHINQFAELTKDEIDKMTEVFTQTPKYFPSLTTESPDIRSRLEDTELGAILKTVMKNFESQASVDSLMEAVLKEANSTNGNKNDVTAETLDSLDILF